MRSSVHVRARATAAQSAGVTYAKAEFLSAIPGVLGRQPECAPAIAIMSMLEQLRVDGVVAGAPDERQVLSRMRKRLRGTTEPATFNAAWDRGSHDDSRRRSGARDRRARSSRAGFDRCRIGIDG
jgi:hypothetical protein